MLPSDLLEQLKSSDQIERWIAIYILGDFGTDEATRALESLLKCETEPSVRQIAEVAIKKINQHLVSKPITLTEITQEKNYQQMEMYFL